ncbi:hypothetical protein FQA39_LY08035 [Lamprigera yunnana]|nr:hypothetical protein FQA39_LY08035 [Lamprigera yunnana]
MDKCMLFYCLTILTLNAIYDVEGQCTQNEECVLIKSCPSILNAIVNNLSAAEAQRLKDKQCGYNYSIKQPKVCCTKTIETIPETNLLPDADVCGQDPNKRIVGGQLTDLRQFPWLTLLEYQKPTGRGFNCGGSLINNYYVLTAAHCVRRIPTNWKLISVRLGEHQLNTDPDCDDDRPGFEDCADSPFDIPIAQAIVHPEYNSQYSAGPHDIALLKLSRPISYSKSISPICLPRSSEFLTKDFTDTLMTVAGWGRTENSSQSNIKLKLEIPVNSKNDCSKIYSRYGVQLGDGQLCAGGKKGEDSCSGDSGGPLMYLRRTGIEYNWYHYATVSFGPIECGSKDFPGIYTLTTKYMNWIISNIKP